MNPDTKEKASLVTFVSGLGLIGCAVADAAINPFAFITAPKLFMSGTGLLMISFGMNPLGGKSGTS